MLRAAVVGLGWWGRHVVGCLRDSDRIRVTHGVDVNMDAAGAFVAERELTPCRGYEDALRDTAVDAVILTTPHGLHEEQVVQAAAAGKQVFCEKPLALSAAGAERMLRACDEKGLIVGIGHERRYERALEEMKRRVDAGEFGALLHIEIHWSHDRFAGAPEPGWRQDPEQAPAGMLTALGVHMTDYMQSVAGPVAELSARTAHRSADFPTDDVLTVQFAFASGATGYMCNIATTPFHQRICMFGDRGWIESREVSNVDERDPALLTWRGADGDIHTRTCRWTDVVRANLEAWADAVEGRSPYRFTREQKLHNVQILEAIVESASTGRPRPVG